MDEKELKSLNETELRAQSLERQFEDINAWRAGKDAFVDDLQANPREIINNNVRIAARSHAEARNLRARAQKLEEEGKTVSRSEISGFWQKYALSTAQEVQEEERQRSKESVQNVLNKNIKQTYNVIRFDASGNRMP